MDRGVLAYVMIPGLQMMFTWLARAAALGSGHELEAFIPKQTPQTSG